MYSKGHLQQLDYFIDIAITINGSNFCRKNYSEGGKVKPYIISVIFSPWNSLNAKNLDLKT